MPPSRPILCVAYYLPLIVCLEPKTRKLRVHVSLVLLDLVTIATQTIVIQTILD